ncbi:MAG: chlorite dismutase family protein [Candidatus Promineifilaceae bacterium]
MSLDIQQRQDDEQIDLREKGRGADGQTIALDRRLYMQFLAFGNAGNTAVLARSLSDTGMPFVLYEDLNDPYGVGLLTFYDQPDFFLENVRPYLQHAPFRELTMKPELTMFGRTYAIGYESDLERTLITRPAERVADPATPWAIWYPLRRKGEFVNLPAQEQRTILMEHGGIGRAYGRAGHGGDIRLACYGMDKNDNDFVVALIGPELHPLSAIVERMRKTKQTSTYLASLGPFFVGKQAASQLGTINSQQKTEGTEN